MLKRVDVASYEVFKTANEGTWKSGIKVLGLAEDGVGWSLDQHNVGLVEKGMIMRVEMIRGDIINGKIKVHDYMSNNSCPVQ